MCKNWKISYAIRGVENDKELREFLLENFPSPKVLNLIKGKIDLITSNPFKYAREKLGRDKYNNPMFSIEVTGNIRILYSVDAKTVLFTFGGLGSIRRFTLSLFPFFSHFDKLVPELIMLFLALKDYKCYILFLHNIHMYKVVERG